MELRSELIRLAHRSPELRKDILPLVSKTAGTSLTQNQFLVRIKTLEHLLDKVAGLSLKIDNNGKNVVTNDDLKKFDEVVDLILSEDQPQQFLTSYAAGLAMRTTLPKDS